MGGARKPFLELAGKPVLLRALEPFLSHPWVDAVVVALPAEEVADPPVWLCRLDGRIRLVEGGATRTGSVERALGALPEDLELLVIHDGARPLVTVETIDDCLRVAALGMGGVAGHPAVDTLKEVDAVGRIVRSPSRSTLWHAQTPQAFPAPLVRSAYRQAIREGWEETDDAAVVARAGGVVRMVLSPTSNLKVTHHGDLAVARLLLGEGS